MGLRTRRYGSSAESPPVSSVTQRGPYKRPKAPTVVKHPLAPQKIAGQKLGEPAPKRPKPNTGG